MNLFILPFLQLHLKMTGLPVCPEVHSQRREREGRTVGMGYFRNRCTARLSPNRRNGSVPAPWDRRFPWAVVAEVMG